MTYSKFMALATMAKKLGIKTLGELAEYKAKYGIQTNEELYAALSYHAVFIVKEVCGE